MAECDNSLTTMDWLSAVDVQIAPAKNELLESSLSLTNPSSTKDPFEDFRPLERETGKPSHSYSTLIKLAILSTRSKRMSLRQIYKWISDNFPYYKDARNGWKNSIRHNLSLNKCFIKVPRDKGDMGKGCYWSLREGFRPESTPAGAGMRMPTITVTSSGGATPQHPVFGTAGVNCGSGSSGNASFINQTPLPPPPAGVSQPGQDGIPDLTDSTVGALAALMGSQSDQVLGAALAPSVTGAQAHQQLPGSSTMMQLPSQPDPSPCLTPPPPPSLSPPSAGAADQLSLSASLQTICRSLLGESSSGGSSGGVGIGAFASVETGGGSSGGSSSGEGASCQAPDLSASTLDFVQRMLPQLKDSFQLSDSALHDLWDHCRSTSRPSAVPESGHHQDGSPNAGTFNGVIQLPTAVEVQRQQQNARLPAQLQPRTQQQPPPPPPPRWGQQPQPAQSQSHRPAHDSGQEVEDEFNWDSIL